MYFSAFYCLFMIGFHFYKGYGGLSYPPIVWNLELICLVIFSIVQYTRIYFGYMANRMEQSSLSCLFVFDESSSNRVVQVGGSAAGRRLTSRRAWPAAR